MVTQEQENLQAALEDFQMGYEGLFSLLERYPERLVLQGGACGDWSPKQTIDHLSGWIVEALQRYEEYNKATYDPKIYDDFDAFNAESVAARVDQSWDESVAELYQRYETIVQAAGQVTAEQLNRTIGYTEWLITLAEDCELHTHQLEQFLQENES